MVNVQKWLDQEYPKQQKKNVTKIHSNYQSLEGSVKIEKFTNLKELSINHNEITKIEVINCPNLEIISCDWNKLTELKLQGCPNLKKLCCFNNYLVSLDLSQNSELEELNIENNNFSAEQNLSFLSHLVNLRELKLGNSLASIYGGELANEQVRKKVQQGSYNHFTGSLESLQGLTKLCYLDISNTELDDGLEYLPNSITSFSCSTNLRKGAKVRTIYNLFADEQGIVETTQSDGSGSIKDFLQKLPEAKQKPRDQINQVVAQRKLQRKLVAGEEVIKTEIRDFVNRFKNQEAKKALEQDNLKGYRQFLSDLGSARLFNALIKEMSGGDPESRAHKVVYRLEKMIEEWVKIMEETKRIENDLDYRKKIKDEVVKQNTDLLTKIDDIHQLILFEIKLSEQETIFNQRIKPLKGNWNNQIKSKKTEISNVLYRGKGNSIQLRREVNELQEKMLDCKKIVQQSQEAQKVINQVWENNNREELVEIRNYLNILPQALQKEDNNQVCEGIYQIIEEIREKHKEIKEIYKSIEGNIEEKKAEVAKHVSVVRRLTQKLLGNQQLQTNVEVLT